MRITETAIAGVVIIAGDLVVEEDGQVIRAYDAAELTSHGLEAGVEQSCLSTNARRNTIRGLHYQTGPADGAKTVRVTRGAIFDVAVDLRPASPTFCQWVGVELSDHDPTGLYIPAGCADGYQTLVDE